VASLRLRLSRRPDRHRCRAGVTRRHQADVAVVQARRISGDPTGRRARRPVWGSA